MEAGVIGVAESSGRGGPATGDFLEQEAAAAGRIASAEDERERGTAGNRE